MFTHGSAAVPGGAALHCVGRGGPAASHLQRHRAQAPPRIHVLLHSLDQVSGNISALLFTFNCTRFPSDWSAQVSFPSPSSPTSTSVSTFAFARTVAPRYCQHLEFNVQSLSWTGAVPLPADAEGGEPRRHPHRHRPRLPYLQHAQAHPKPHRVARLPGQCPAPSLHAKIIFIFGAE